MLWWMFDPRIELRWVLDRPLQFFSLVLLYPTAEEVVFRGAVQTTLRRSTWASGSWYGLTRANIITSLLFATLHFFFHTPVWAALVFVPSLVFGYFRDRHDSLCSPIALHIWYNSGYFLLFQP